ncbi:MAG: formylglycine-generating enzyme family protein [Polyangiaceae bacterium]|nr:formylglycine-generating enzyme family protein [Polyangiaceae bacterium]
MNHRQASEIGLLGATAIGALVGATALGLRWAERPARCGVGFVAGPTRCCLLGQSERDGRCVGTVNRCPSGFSWSGLGEPGCVVVPSRVSIGGGELALGPVDWEGAVPTPLGRTLVRGFAIDAHEVTLDAWRRCAVAGVCRGLPAREPGLPVTQVSAAEAARYCRFVGGRLPRSDEWVFAAAGSNGRRYPWGSTGLVCRRAVFGLMAGPCARGGRGPELAGSRPDGATPDGIYDLAGNVAEWTLEPGGETAVRGGTYASRFAADLKSWAATTATGPDERVGFRCVYQAR